MASTSPIQTPTPRSTRYTGTQPEPQFRKQVGTDFNQLSSYVKERQSTGLDANLPPFGSPGRIYIATDTFRMYVDLGSSWVYVNLTI